jgi:hypothetical protein
VLRSHSVPTELHHIPFRAGYEETIKNTDKILKSDKKIGSFDQYREFCSQSLPLVHSTFLKVFVMGSHPAYISNVIDYQNLLKIFVYFSKEILE